MVGKQKEHASADWVGYVLRAHLQWTSLCGWDIKAADAAVL